LSIENGSRQSRVYPRAENKVALRDMFAEVRMYARCNCGARVLLNMPDVRFATWYHIRCNFVERRTRNSLDTSENPRLRNRDDMTRELYAFVYGSFRTACMIVTGEPERERERGKKEVDIELMYNLHELIHSVFVR